MPIAILGTAQSGTSMIARMLGLCGVYFDASLETPSRRHASTSLPGVSSGVADLNQRLVKSVEALDPSLATLPDGWQSISTLKCLYDEAKTMIEQRFTSRGEWALILPKTPFTVPFWQSVIPNLRLIICVRNPLDYARSITRYGKVSQEDALSAWQYFNLEILAATSTLSSKRVLTYYDDYFPDYLRGLQPLLTWLDLECPKPGGEVDDAICAVHDPELKYHSSSLEDLIIDPHVPYLAKELYLELLSSDTYSGDVPILAQAQLYMPLLRKAMRNQRGAGETNRQLKEKVDDLERSLTMLSHQHRELEQILASRTHRVAASICSLLIRYRKPLQPTSNSRKKPDAPVFSMARISRRDASKA